MATRDIVPRANNEGNIGTAEKMWAGGYFHTVQADHITGTDGIYVQHYGALGDGVTDDSGAIQDAIDAAIEGGTVIIPQTASYYKITATQLSEALTVSTRINLIINGELRATSHANQANPPFILNVTAAGTTISGIGTLRGNGSYIATEATLANRPGLLRIAADKVEVSGLNFVNPQSLGILVTSADKVRIVGNKFTGGPLVDDQNIAAGQNKIFYIYSSSTDKLEISHNKFYANATAGAACNGVGGSGDTHISIVDNIFEDIHEHATYTYCSNGLVAGNHVTYSQAVANQRGAAILIGGNYNVVTDNVIENALYGGITVRSPVGNIISNNHLENIGYMGVGIVTSSDFDTDFGINDNTISGNYLKAATSGTIYDGIRYYNEHNHATSYGGKILNNVVIGFGNVSDLTYQSITLWSNFSDHTMIDMEITGNTITGSVYHGIYLQYTSQIRIARNHIYNNPVADFRAISPVYSTGLRIENNLVEDYQDTPTLYQLFYSTANTTDIWMQDNEVYGSTIANCFGHSTTRNILGRGNKSSRTVALVGTFTMNNEATKVVNNANFFNGTVTDRVSTVLITPLGANSALVMGSAKSLYVSTSTAGTSFTVATSDGNVVPATDHVFAYEIIQ